MDQLYTSEGDPYSQHKHSFMKNFQSKPMLIRDTSIMKMNDTSYIDIKTSQPGSPTHHRANRTMKEASKTKDLSPDQFYA